MNLNARLRSGQQLFGCFISIAHPASVEVCATQLFDLLCIDAEHGQLSRERIEELVRAGDCAARPMMVRVPDALPHWIGSVLDCGAQAVLVPRVSDAEQARLTASAGRYPPRGRRGIGPGRATRYGYEVADYLAQANDRVLICVQIETAEGLANVDAIAAVDGVDVLFVGPFDLALSIGANAPSQAEMLEEAIKNVAAAARRHGKIAGIFRPGATDVSKWADAGFKLFLIGSDAMFIGAAAGAVLAIARGASTNL
jgi:4-hydroxy-2-oxoheptanedioate aldolase